MSNRKRNVRVPEFLSEPSERLIKILIALERYNHLDTYHLCLITGLSYDNIEAPLRDGFHAGLIDRPGNNKYRRDRQNDALVHKHTQVATDWLARNNLTPPRAIYVGRGGQPPHDLGVSQLMACIEAAHKKAGFRFYTADEILAKAPEKTQRLETPFRFETLPNEEGKPRFGHKIPDAVFATGYDDDEFWLSFVELNLSDHGEKEYKRITRAYADIIFGGIYKQQLGMTQNARVLTFDCDAHTMNVMRKHTESRDPSYFKHIPEYGEYQRAPLPLADILDNWRTSTNKTITLKEVN